MSPLQLERSLSSSPRERTVSLEASEKDLKTAASIIKGNAKILGNGGKIDMIMNDVQSEFKTLNIDLGTHDVGEKLRNYLDLKDPYISNIFEILLAGKNRNLMENHGLKKKDIENHYGLSADNIKKYAKNPTEAQLKKETERILLLNKQYEVAISLLSPVNRQEMRTRMLKEMDYHLKEVGAIESNNPDFKKARTRLESLREQMERL